MDLEALARAHRQEFAGRPAAVREIKPSLRDFARYVSTRREELAVLGEFRRLDPDRGRLGEADPASFVREVEAGGGYGVSICCEGPWAGSLEDLGRAAGATALPVLARGIVLDEQDLYRLRAAGADAAVVYASLHDAAGLSALRKAARSLLMELLVEVSDEASLSSALESGCPVLAVPGNDLARARELLSRIPTGRTPVLSGGTVDAAALAPLLPLLDAVLLVEPLMAAGVEGVRALVEPYTRLV